MKIKRITWCAALAVLAGCSHEGTPPSKPSEPSGKFVQALGCRTFESIFWDTLNADLLKDRFPDVSALKEKLRQGAGDVVATDEQSKQVEFLIDSVLTDLPREEGLQTARQLLEWTSALEFGDTTTPARLEWYLKLRPSLQALSQGRGDADCPVADDELGAMSVARGPAQDAQSGLRWAFATAYQSCQALAKAPVDLTTPDVQGIKTWCCHPDGVGFRRVIEDLPKVLQSHPYVSSDAPAAGCLDQRAKPLIYDYGGKPQAISGNALDFHQDAGDGTTALGIDCSGYVFTSLATAGLRLKSGMSIKASSVFAVSSGSFVEFENGPSPMDCLERVPFRTGAGLAPGAIAAVYGHVLFVDTVGADPWGIGKTKNKADCANITFKDFDFVIAQSSNSKNGVGLNRFEAKAYLADSLKMKAGFETEARKACESFWDQSSVRPVVSEFVLLRHRGTAECRGSRVALAHESCVQSCPAPVR